MKRSHFPPLRRALIRWFSGHFEDLPWRQDRSPYRVWVSEIMLQQTQVGTVIPYYERFMARFPDVQALAAAPLDDVLKHWEGLGYYSRARNLHRAARIVVRDHGGHLPTSVDGLLNLPGVGRSTAGAIASLAFGLSAPVLDGNVIRVLARWFNLAGDVSEAETREQLWDLACSLAPADQPGVWNEALMGLGQQICMPRDPACQVCPVERWCEARRLGVQADRPVKRKRAPLPHYEVAAGVIAGSDGRILIAQRKPTVMLGGLWEFPGGKREPGESLQECLAREVREELGIEIEVGAQFAQVRHTYTHFRITLFAFDCRHVGGLPQALDCAAWAWVTLDELDRYAFPRADRAIIEALSGDRQLRLGF